MSISSLNPMIHHLLESSHRDNSKKWSNIGFGEQITQVVLIEINVMNIILAQCDIMLCCYSGRLCTESWWPCWHVSYPSPSSTVSWTGSASAPRSSLTTLNSSHCSATWTRRTHRSRSGWTQYRGTTWTSRPWALTRCMHSWRRRQNRGKGHNIRATSFDVYSLKNTTVISGK